MKHDSSMLPSDPRTDIPITIDRIIIQIPVQTTCKRGITRITAK